MDGPTAPTLSDRMALARRRVITGAVALFVSAWIAVFALGQHATASSSTSSSAQAAAPPATSSGQGSSAGGDDSVGGQDGAEGYDDGGYDGAGPVAPDTSAGGGSSTAQPPLVTSQS